MATEKMTGVDAAWWHIDRPSNIAMIAGVMVFDTPIDLERLTTVLTERFLVYDRFHQRVREPLLRLGVPYWEDDKRFDWSYHLKRVRLPAPASQVELQQLVGELMSTPLDPRHPLWQMYYVENYQGGCALVSRLHHCMADGLALVQVLLSLTDDRPDGARFASPVQAVAHPAGRAPFRPLTHFIDATADMTRLVAREALVTITEPSRITQALSLGGLGVTAASKLLLLSPDTKTLINGKSGLEKRAAWSEAIPLGDVKRVGEALGGTINDVLLTAATGALRRYLVRRGQDVTGLNLRTMVPVSVRSARDMNKLGNQFGLIILSLPVGVHDPLTRLHVLKQRMDDIKDTPEALVAFGVLSLVGVTPMRIEKHVIDFFAAKTSAVMTNVPGPRRPLYLAGQRLRSLMFWVPRAGEIGLGLSILSYAGNVYVGIAADAGLLPDPQTLVNDFHAELAELQRLVSPARTNRAPITAPAANGHCQALTQSGNPCRNRAAPHSAYCRRHANQAAPVPDG